MKGIKHNKSLSSEVRYRVVQSNIETILAHGCESWIISKQIGKSLEATEI
uniref:Uncharacterized protein n=1 Tax=Arion vulgaris TaxID=1028688 RepID=A0A0B6ZD34_9EUPU